MPSPLASRICALLAQDDSGLRNQAAESLIEHLLSQRLQDVADLPQLVAVVLGTLRTESLERVLSRHVQPGISRYDQHVAAAPERVVDLVGPRAADALRALLAAASGARGKFMRGAVDPALLKRLLAPVWVQLLVDFSKRIPIPGVGAASSGSGTGAAAAGRGIASMLGKSVQQSAERLVGAGRSALEGLGIDVEKKLNAAARDFSEGALGIWNQALRERLQSDEGKAIIVQIKLSVLEHILRVQLQDIHRDAMKLPLPAYVDLAPAIVSHAVQLPFLQRFIQAEVQAYLAVEGEHSLSELLSDLGALEPARSWLKARVEQQIAGWSQSTSFASWLTELIERAQVD
jgi:hypothetical protein